MMHSELPWSPGKECCKGSSLLPRLGEKESAGSLECCGFTQRESAAIINGHWSAACAGAELLWAPDSGQVSPVTLRVLHLSAAAALKAELLQMLPELPVEGRS